MKGEGEKPFISLSYSSREADNSNPAVFLSRASLPWFVMWEEEDARVVRVSCFRFSPNLRICCVPFLMAKRVYQAWKGSNVRISLFKNFWISYFMRFSSDVLQCLLSEWRLTDFGGFRWRDALAVLLCLGFMLNFVLDLLYRSRIDRLRTCRFCR